MLNEDMSVFFDASEHADVFTVARFAPPNNTITGIFGEASEEALSGHAIGERRQLRYADGSLLLVDGDVLERGSERFKVRGAPERQNDGKELVVQLFKVTI